MRVLLAVLVLVLSGCASSGPPHIVVWTGDTLPDRVAATRAIFDRFTEQTGTTVELVSVDEDQFSAALTRSAASGQLPDVVASQPLSAIRTLNSTELLDVEAAEDVVQRLGPATFEPRSLEMTADGPYQLAVPSDSWVQLIYYRKDLFAAAGLPPPATFADLRHAAEVLTKDGQVGFVGPTVAGDNFTHQVFELFAMANGCEIEGPDHHVLFDSQACVAALSFYNELISRYSVLGSQDVDSVRTDYFSGRAAMTVWSTFLLDELIGLRDDVLPACPQCAADPLFLAHNTGAVSGLSGNFSSRPVQFGEINSWAILVDSDPAAREFVHFMLSDGYLDWLAFAPEGKAPLRRGLTPGGTEYLEAWRKLPVGVDREALLVDYYPPDVIEALERTPETFEQWGGDLVGASLAEMPVATAVSRTVRGELSPQQAAEEAAETLRAIEVSLPR